MKKSLLAGLLLALPMTALAAGPTTDQRLQRLERILQNQSLSDMVLQIQRLQQEVRQLRGQLEVQEHAMQNMQKRQRDLYLDLDSRITQLQQSPSGTLIPNAPLTAADGVTAVPAADPTQPSSQAVSDTPPPPPPPPPPLAAAQAPGDPAQEQARYRQAFDLLQQGNYTESAQAFRDFLAAYPNGGYADNAQYWLAEASYVTRDFDTAMQDFDQVLKAHPSSSKVPGAMLKIGYIRYEWREWKKARDMLQDLIDRHPASTEARLAKQRLDRMRKEGR